jgi:serine/threonine protein kinase
MLDNTLEDWISSRKKIKNVKSILQQITTWLKKHHNNPNDNHVHGELTPDHIYLNEKGKKVMDIKLKNLTTDSSLQNEGWRPAEETNLSPSQEGDIFSLGCLFYYVISSGGHPFGCYPKHRKIFITYHLYELGCYQLGSCSLDDVQIRNLISIMIHYDPKKRPTCSEVLKHPFFSGNKKTGLDSTSDDEHDSEKVGT